VTAAAVHAERQIVAGLEGDCDSAIAVLVEPERAAPLAAPAKPTDVGAAAAPRLPADYRLRGRVVIADGQTCLEADERVAAKLMGRRIKGVLETLRQRGAAAVLGREQAGILTGSP
jgi:porphobilinogen deaminase